MAYKLIHKNIISIKADAIVNAANSKPICTPGNEMTLYAAAGAGELLRARQSIGDIIVGDAAVTTAFNLNAKYIIHTVVPIVNKDTRTKNTDALRRCYRNALRQASDLRCRNVAMPIFMLDNYYFPKEQAVNIAMEEISTYKSSTDLMIYLVVSELEEFVLSENLITRMEDLLGLREKESAVVFNENLDDVVKVSCESFGEMFFRLVDERGLTDAAVYNKANVTRKVISKLRVNPDKNVDKKTALALAIGLELDIYETEEFIKLAGYALSPRMKFDRIVRYFIENGNYNLMELNEALFKYTEKVLVGVEK